MTRSRRRVLESRLPSAMLGGVVITGLLITATPQPSWAASAVARAPVRTAGLPAESPWMHPADALGPDTLAVIGLRDGAARSGDLQAMWRDRLATGPLGELVMSIPDLEAARIGWFGMAAAAGTDPWSAAGALMGDRMAIGLRPSRGGGDDGGDQGDDGAGGGGTDPTPVAVAFATGEQAMIVDRLMDSVRSLAGIQRGRRIDPERQYTFADGTVTRVSPQLSIGRRGGYLVVSPDEAVVRETLQRLDAADPQDRTTAAPAELPPALAARTPGLRAAATAAAADDHARVTVPADATLWAELSPAVIAQAANAIPMRLDDPLGAVLAGGWVRAAASAERALGWMRWSADELRVTIDLPSGDGLPATHTAFRTPARTFTTLDVRGIAGYLGEFSMPRDMAAIVQHRESLMIAGASSQMIDFVNGVSAIMGGFDVLEEVFARLGGPMRVIAVNRPAAGDDDMRPVPELPMFAVVLPIQSPSPDLDARLRSGAFTALGIINIERGEQQQPGLLVDTDRVGDVRYVVGRFPAPPAGQAPDMTANFAPAIAMIGDRVVLSSDADLLRQLASTAAERTSDAADELQVSGLALRDILARNRETIIAGRMINEGETRAAAAAFTDGLLATLAVVREIGARVTVTDTATRGEMVVRLDLGGDR